MKKLRISQIFLLIYGVSTIFLIFIGLIIFMVYQSQNLLMSKYENRYQSYLLADELRQSSDDLTRFARTYVINGDSKYEKYYWDILAIRNGEKARPEFYERIYWDLVAHNGQKPRPDGKTIALQSLMKDAGFTETEFEKLKQAQQNSDDLVFTETVAMNAMKGILLDSNGKFVQKGMPDHELARRIMHDDKYHSDKAKIMKPIDDFFKMLNIRTQKSVDEKKYLNLRLMIFLATFLLVTMLITAVSYWIIHKKIIYPITQLNHYSEKIALGDFSQELPIKSENEVGKLAKAINQLAENIRLKSDFVVQIGQGKLQVDLQPTSQNDEMGLALIEMKQNLQKIAEEDAIRNWEIEGIAMFNEMLRKETQDVKLLADSLVSALVKYIQANQGGMYLADVQDGTTILNLISAYAYDRKKFQKKQFFFNEGLIGQAFQEQETIYLTNVPQEYLTITSGLGTANANYVLIVPLKTENSTEGVLEIASFMPFETYQTRFVEKIAEAIASTLISVKTNQQTLELLQTTQEQTESLKAQEEELRQNLEELQTTQELMQLKNKEAETLNQKLKESEVELIEKLKQMDKLREEMEIKDRKYRRKIKNLQNELKYLQNSDKI